MAKILGDVKDFDDYKQKIVKQRQLRKKTINSVKQYLSNEEVKLKPRSNNLFKNNLEKYEYLIVNDPDNSWITEFQNTKEYKLLYE